MYGLERLSDPSAEPVTLAEAKLWLRVDHSSDDTLISSLIATVRSQVERETGRQLMQCQWLLSLDRFPYPGGWQFLENPYTSDPNIIRIPKAPLVSVQSVQYYDMGDVLRTLSSGVYDVDTKTDPGRIVLGMGQTWPVTRLKPGVVRISITAGYASAAAVPDELKTAIKLGVAYLYENRGETGDNVALDMPRAFYRLCQAASNGEREYGFQ